uniref:GPI ethanolamine phosphate transferase 2 C-terminal domain-containing protein n=1 Tax=Globisporangium ultimum (strain ATCC 200006 / CBS 805.95 / DAOM BR144) TaxID=431595 RepID=K3WUI9_GLOUD
MTMRMPRVWILCACALAGVYLCASGLLRLNEVFTQPSPASPSVPSGSAERAATFDAAAKQGPQYDRLVVVLIDALRADMVLGGDVMYGKAMANGGEDLSANMPYTRGLVTSGQALGYVGHASVPTVTMPRLKAIVTGKAPAFIDILKNFNSVALSEVNLVDLFVAHGHRIVFYGDDTWLKLFPSAFQRSDGTSGFFTRDTVEVDDNVTRHLKDELDPTMQASESQDWDVLVLHYLGLDHVGHLRGPRSTMMVDKLHEMDAIVAQVHASVQQQDALRREKSPSALPSLIVLCSDHGMSEVGNHGGATVEESSALMLFLRGDGHNMKQDSYQQKRKQVDLVPTIASLFGLGIPPYSTGLILDEVVQASALSPGATHYISALLANYDQLYKLAVVKFHASSLTDFDTKYGAAVEALRKLLQQSNKRGNDLEPSHGLKRVIREACGVLQEKIAQSDGSEYNERMIFFGICFLLCSAEVSIRMLYTNRQQEAKRDPVTWILLLGSILQVVSLTSSSSIENEHATAFFLITTALCGCAVKLLKAQVANSRHHESTPMGLALPALVLLVTRILRSRNQVINFGRLNSIQVDSQQPGNEFATDDSVSILSTAPIFEDVIPFEAYFVVISGLVLWKASRFYTKRTLRSHPLAVLGLTLSSFMFTMGMVASLLCKRVGDVEGNSSLFIAYSADDYARAVYTAVALLMCLLVVNCMARVLVVEMILWLLVMLVQREANIPTLGWLCIQLFLLTKTLQRHPSLLANGVALGLFSVWLAQTSFFALGNSHLVTTIDLSQSYHGLSGYTQSIVGLLTFVNVFSGPLLVFVHAQQWIHLVATSPSSSRLNGTSSTQVAPISATRAATAMDAGLALFAYQTLRFAVYTIVVYCMRFHLFIWSVFAPKMLYEVVQTAVVLVVALIVSPATMVSNSCGSNSTRK